MKKKKKIWKKKNVATWVIVVLAIVCIIVGIIEVKKSFINFNRAAGYSEKILNLFLKDGK